ncbi:hypothetical protein X907_0560 [Glycocaulis alkaliphilus]|uniref:Uncharacterized protein n=1 Tax=Glycocaulis alkaliphilus TaxID=1434191 RepID=A0A3T0E7A3_9PROT|nr:type II secretion system protein GspK [Glycocaulis alkaliphilus]AZU03107.1 hypothetical protein X907_0560 [Glycocaulis alkaliphilus]GGB71052.1 hypothetical protein GCM10007417_08550 [Glycocaulis alkaliphilus]
MVLTRPGYVFPLTLGVIAILAVLIAAAYAVHESASGSVRQWVDRQALERDLHSAEVHVLHTFLAEPMGWDAVHVGGVPSLDPDYPDFVVEGEKVSLRGQPYRVVLDGREMMVRIIAVAGLISIDTTRPGSVSAFLVTQGLDLAEASRLEARLYDYEDDDDLRRLGGAEADDYPDGRAPANTYLRRASELCAVLGWDQLDLCRQPVLFDLYANIVPGTPMSPAFMPDHVASVLIDREREREVALERLQAGQALTFADLFLPGWDSVHYDEFGYGPAGSEFLFLTQEAAGTLIRVARIRLTYGAFEAPYERMFEFLTGGEQVEAAFRIDDPGELADFPATQPQSRQGFRR